MRKTHDSTIGKPPTTSDTSSKTTISQSGRPSRSKKKINNNNTGLTLNSEEFDADGIAAELGELSSSRSGSASSSSFPSSSNIRGSKTPGSSPRLAASEIFQQSSIPANVEQNGPGPSASTYSDSRKFFIADPGSGRAGSPSDAFIDQDGAGTHDEGLQPSIGRFAPTPVHSDTQHPSGISLAAGGPSRLTSSFYRPNSPPAALSGSLFSSPRSGRRTAASSPTQSLEDPHAHPSLPISEDQFAPSGALASDQEDEDADPASRFSNQNVSHTGSNAMPSSPTSKNAGRPRRWLYY